MRRGSDDPEWQALKLRVNRRDRRVCRIMRLLTPHEAYTLQECAQRTGKSVQKLEHAHIIPVGACLPLVYADNNVVLLNSFSHYCLDNCKHPVTGRAIPVEVRNDWWRRIAGKDQWQWLMKSGFSGILGIDEEDESREQ